MPTEIPAPRVEPSSEMPSVVSSLAPAVPASASAPTANSPRIAACIGISLSRKSGRRGRGLFGLELEFELVVLDGDVHVAAVGELAEQQLLRQRPLHAFLDHARHRAGAHLLVVAVL